MTPLETCRQLADELLSALTTRPLVCFTLVTVLGIAWADVAAPAPWSLGALLVLALVLVWLTIRLGSPGQGRLLLVALFLCGAFLHAWRLWPTPADCLPPVGLDRPQLQATVLSLRGQGTTWQTVTVAPVASAASPLPRRVLMSLPNQPPVQPGQTLLLRQVQLWRPRGAGTPGEQDRARELARAGIHAQGRARQMTVLAPPTSARFSLAVWLATARARMLAALTAAMPGPNPRVYAELLAGMVYGMKAAPLPDDVITIFRRSGTIHVLVASGTQVSIIAFTLIFLVRGTRRGLPPWGMPFVIVGLLALALLAGLGASINRAVAMAVVLLGSFVVGRKYDFPSALALSALVLCVLNTATVFDVGAQLTYACSLGVYLALPPAQQDAFGSTRRSHFSLVLWSTLGAWLLSTPVLVAHFGNLVLLGGLANLLAVPLAAVLLYLGLGGVVLALIAAPLAAPLCWLARCLLDLLLTCNTWLASLPLATIDTIHWSLPTTLLWYVVVGGGFWLWRSAQARGALRAIGWRWGVAVGTAGCGILVLTAALGQVQGQQLQVSILDVGAGQCVLVQAPGHRNLLIDAGTEPFSASALTGARRRVLPYLALRHVSSLDAIFISHPHDDHCNLAAEVVRSIPTRRLLVGPEQKAEQSYADLLQAARQRGTEVLPAQAGERLQIATDLQIQVLEPTTLLNRTDDDQNNNSLVLKLTYGQTSILFPADLQQEGEQRLLADYQAQPETLRSEVLVAAHHASIHSDSAEFVDAVQPRMVVVSCGSGPRAPRAQALHVFQDRQLPIWRTDQCGTLLLASDGRQVRIRGYRNN